MAAPGHDGQYDPVRAGVEHRQISGIPRACGSVSYTHLAVGMAEVVSDTLGQGFAGKSIMGILASILVMATVFMSALWDIIKGFVKYYDFKVKRIEDRLYICLLYTSSGF